MGYRYILGAHRFYFLEAKSLHTPHHYIVGILVVCYHGSLAIRLRADRCRRTLEVVSYPKDVIQGLGFALVVRLGDGIASSRLQQVKLLL